jgi:toxin ParE1/3/4
MRPVVFRRAVARDLAAGFDWYETRRLGLGGEFLAAVNAAFRSLGGHPEMYSVALPGVRRILVSRFPYAVFYAEEPRRVVVLTVLHTARDPNLWPSRRRSGKA